MTEPAYTVQWTATAQRNLRRLPEKVVTAVVEFSYGSLADNPHRLGRPLHLELAGLHGARRGDYRIVYQIDEDTRALLIMRVDHRADVYRNQ